MKVADMPASSADFCGTTHAAKLLGLSVGTVQTLVEKSKPRLKVLVVEDDAVSRDMMKAYFERWDLPIDCNAMASALDALTVTGLSPEEIEARGGLPERTVYVRKPVDMRWLNGYLVALLSARSAAQVASS